MKMTVRLPPWGPTVRKVGISVLNVMDWFGASNERKKRVAKMFARIGTWRFRVESVDLGDRKP